MIVTAAELAALRAVSAPLTEAEIDALLAPLALSYDRTVSGLLALQREDRSCTSNRAIGRRRCRNWGIAECFECAGVYVQPTRQFLAGDVVLGCFNNGQAERLRVDGYSFKKRSMVLDLMQSYARTWDPLAYRRVKFPECQHHENRTRLRVVLPPGGFTRDGLELASWTDPAVRRFILSGLHAACAALPVRMASGARGSGAEAPSELPGPRVPGNGGA